MRRTNLLQFRTSSYDNLSVLQLVDLLGYDHFDLLTAVLKDREPLVEESRTAIAHNLVSAAATVSKRNLATFDPEAVADAFRKKAPVIGQQITVQSELEKQLRKEMRKEEKRLAKLQHKVGSAVEDLEPSEFLDIDELRRRCVLLLQRRQHWKCFTVVSFRELEYEAAQSEPLFRQEAAALAVLSAQELAKYPYIFDSSLNASSKSLIRGEKVSCLVFPRGVVQY